MSEKEKVKVKITTIHKTDEGEFPLIIEADGTYKKIGEIHYITYEYIDEESKANIKTLIKCNGESVEVISDGDSKYRMLFDEKIDHISKVDMGGYSMSLKQCTNGVSLMDEGDNINIAIDYELYQGDVLTSACDMKINILRRIQ